MNATEIEKPRNWSLLCVHTDFFDRAGELMPKLGGDISVRPSKFVCNEQRFRFAQTLQSQTLEDAKRWADQEVERQCKADPTITARVTVEKWRCVWKLNEARDRWVAHEDYA